MSVPRVDARLYPFTPKRFDRGQGISMAYVDEGEGPPVVMVHGNPTWSFYYRDLIAAVVSRGFRAIAPDHVGCGFSDKPDDSRYRYTLASRIDDLEHLLEHLHLEKEVSLVVHDWGGAIGFGWAVRHPERLRKLVVMNTAAFHLPAGKAMPWLLSLGRDTKVGALLIERANAFARGATRLAVKRPMSPEVRAGYVAPYEAPGDRIATLRFVQDIPLHPGDLAYPVLSDIAARLPSLAKVPMLLGWGMKDFVFDKHFLAEWLRRFPDAKSSIFQDAGHYVLEDAKEELIPGITSFLTA